MKHLHIIFNNFFDYQIALELLNSQHKYITTSLTNPNELKLSFAHYYHEVTFINHFTGIFEPLNIHFTTEVGEI